MYMSYNQIIDSFAKSPYNIYKGKEYFFQLCKNILNMNHLLYCFVEIKSDMIYEIVGKVKDIEYTLIITIDNISLINNYTNEYRDLITIQEK